LQIFYQLYFSSKVRYKKIIQPKRQNQNVIQSVKTRSKGYPTCESKIKS